MFKVLWMSLWLSKKEPSTSEMRYDFTLLSVFPLFLYSHFESIFVCKGTQTFFFSFLYQSYFSITEMPTLKMTKSIRSPIAPSSPPKQPLKVKLCPSNHKNASDIAKCLPENAKHQPKQSGLLCTCIWVIWWPRWETRRMRVGIVNCYGQMCPKLSSTV